MWRELHQKEKAYSYHSGAHNVFSRLDYLFTPHNTIHRFTEARYLARGITDHAPFIITLAMNQKRPRSEWRMATWRLTNKKEVECLQTVTKKHFEENTGSVDNVETLWEAYKATIRGELIAGEARE